MLKGFVIFLTKFFYKLTIVKSASWSTLFVGNYIILQFSNDLEDLGCIKDFRLVNCEDVSITLKPEQVMNGKSILQGVAKLENSTDNSAETQ